MEGDCWTSSVPVFRWPNLKCRRQIHFSFSTWSQIFETENSRSGTVRGKLRVFSHCPPLCFEDSTSWPIPGKSLKPYVSEEDFLEGSRQRMTVPQLKMANLLWEQILSPNSPLQPGHPTSLWERFMANWAAPCFLSSGSFCSPGPPSGTFSQTHWAGALSLFLDVPHPFCAVFLYPRVHQHALTFNSLPEASWVTLSLVISA